MTWPFSCLARYKSGPEMPMHVLGPALYSVRTVLGVYKVTTELKMGRAHDQASASLKKKSKSMVNGPWKKNAALSRQQRTKQKWSSPKNLPPHSLIKYIGSHFFQAPSVLALKIVLLPHNISKYSSFIIFT